MTTHRAWVVGTLVPHIRDGRKNLEVRVADRRFASVQVGDHLFFNNACTRTVIETRQYGSFAEMSVREHHNRDLIGPVYSWPQILNFLRRKYSREQEGLGVLVFELTKPKKR